LAIAVSLSAATTSAQSPATTADDHAAHDHAAQKHSGVPTTDSPVRSVDVFTSGQGDYHTYRIPAIVSTNSGTLLAFCEARKKGRSDTGNIDTIVRRSKDGGKTWSQPIVVWDDADNTCGNATPVVDRSTGTIWVPLTWNLGSDHESKIKDGTSKFPRRVFVTHSNDDGLTWAKPTEITPSVRKDHWRWYATGPGNAVQLTRGPHAGRLVIPANHSDHTDAETHPYRSHVFWSDDHGTSWQLGGVHQAKTNESAVIERTDGTLLQAMRSYHGTNQRAMSVSDDGGASWSELTLDATLDTPVCQASMLRYSWPASEGHGSNSDSKSAAESNANQQPGKSESRKTSLSDQQTNLVLFASPRGKKRKNLHVWLSYDEGKTWPIAKQIDAGDAAYCNLIALPNNHVGLLYEKGGYQTIALATFPLSWLASFPTD